MKKIPQDIIGNIAILKFKKSVPWILKKLKARKFLKSHKNITTVVEKTSKFEGPLRTHKTKHLAGEKTFQAQYKENNCIFSFDINKSYFSPRLSNERKIISDQVFEIAKKIKNPKILILFAGIGPYPITIAKKFKSAKLPATIISNELNPEANKEAQKNITLNKLQKYITLLPGDANKLPSLLTAKQSNNIKAFDIILMPRPNLDDTFLKTALKLSKKNTTIFYHGFGTKDSVLKEIKKDSGNRIGKIKIRKAGDIGPYIFRWQAQFKVK